jgi:hypothetical protein
VAMFGKSEQERLSDTFNYFAEIHAPQDKINLLFNWVYVDGPFAAATVSEALSLGFGVFSRQGTTKDIRRAIRAAILARFAVETPRNLQAASGAWKGNYQSRNEAQLEVLVNTFLSRLGPPPVVAPVPPLNAVPTNYGITGLDLGAIKSALTTPTAKISGTPPAIAPGSNASSQQKKDFFETVSRQHVILSGHGSWAFDSSINNWPFAPLGSQQIIRFYTKHYFPLGNDAGQLVDNRRFPAPTESFGPSGQVCDYTLHHKDKLVLLNRGGGNADQEFITVNSDTRLSHFLRNPKYSAATFHWAACRVVFNSAGKVECPVHNTWEEFAAACVLHP